MKKTIKFTTLALAGVMAASMAACSGGGGTDTTTASGGDTTATTTAGGSSSDLANTLVYAGEEVSTINPLLDTHGELTQIVFSGLLKLDGNGKPTEDLAESYAFDESALTYTFKLRQGVKWHDGEDFNADDVVYTYKRILEDEALADSIRSDYDNISSVDKKDDYTVEIKLKKLMLPIETYFAIGILPQHLYDGQDLETTEYNQKPIGTGRYKMASWDADGGMITFTANTDYYGKVPNIEKLVYKTVGDETTKATMIQAGEADLAWLNSKYAATFNGNNNFTQWVFKTADYRAASMDMSSDFWKKNADSIGVLNYAVDKQSIVDSVLVGQGETAYSPIQRNPLGTDKEADIYSYDLDKFASEMEKLGWKKGSDGIYERNGDKFHFTIQTREWEVERVDIANVVSNMLKQAGVEMEVVFVQKFDWKSGYNGFLAGYATEFDPDMIYRQYTTDGSDNNMHYSNAEVDKYLEEGRYGATEDARKTAYSNFEKAYAQSPGVLLIAYLEGNYVGVNGLKGLDTTRTLGHHAVGVMWNIEDWTINR